MLNAINGEYWINVQADYLQELKAEKAHKQRLLHGDEEGMCSSSD